VMHPRTTLVTIAPRATHCNYTVKRRRPGVRCAVNPPIPNRIQSDFLRFISHLEIVYR
jgi:hypothetical protein